MANLIFTKGKEGLLDSSINWTTDNIKALLVNTSLYTVSGTSHEYLSDIPSGARVSYSNVLTNRTANNGVADADDVTFGSVAGTQAGAVVIYEDTGNPSSSRLLAYIDSPSALPFTPNGGDVDVTWAAGGIFSL